MMKGRRSSEISSSPPLSFLLLHLLPVGHYSDILTHLHFKHLTSLQGPGLEFLVRRWEVLDSSPLGKKKKENSHILIDIRVLCPAHLLQQMSFPVPVMTVFVKLRINRHGQKRLLPFLDVLGSFMMHHTVFDPLHAAGS